MTANSHSASNSGGSAPTAKSLTQSWRTVGAGPSHDRSRARAVGILSLAKQQGLGCTFSPSFASLSPTFFLKASLSALALGDLYEGVWLPGKPEEMPDSCPCPLPQGAGPYLYPKLPQSLS